MLFAAIIGIDQFIHIWNYHKPMIVGTPVVVSTSTTILIEGTSTITQPQKEIALTFDDGPYGTSTSQILDILEREKVSATFFLIGKNVLNHPDQVCREIADGDVIGNHSFSHSRSLPTMSSSSLRQDISHAEDVITHISCPKVKVSITHLFRAPYSTTSPEMIKEINREGYTFMGWNIDSRDWDNTNSSSTVISNVLNNIKPGGVIIFHDGHEYGTDYSRENTIQALPVIIHTLKKEGYIFE